MFLGLLLILTTRWEASAQVRIWDNGGATGNWGDVANWSADNVPDSALETAQFGAVNPGAINQNIGGGGIGITVGQIEFTSGGIARTFSGNPIAISGLAGVGIVNNSSALQTFSLSPLSITASQAWNAASGPISVNSSVAMGGNVLTIGGDNNTTISGVIVGTAAGGLTKTGSGTLTLSGANTYAGLTTVSAGTLIAANNAALGATSGNTTVASGATLALQGGVTIGTGEDLTTLTGSGVGGAGALRNLSGNNRWRGIITLGGDSTISSDAGTLSLGVSTTTPVQLSLGGNTLTFDGAGNIINNMFITGSGNVIKRGSGMVTFTTTSANTFTGSTTVEEGTLALDHVNNANAAIAGPLIIGDGTGAAGSAIVQLGVFNLGNDQIANASPVTVNSDGRFRLNGQVETIGSLTMTGSSVDMDQFNAPGAAIGTLTLGGNVTANAASTTATISGNLALGGASRTFTVADGSAAVDLAVSAVISGTTGLTKAGAGLLELSGANTFSGNITNNAGTIRVSTDANLGNAANGIQFNGATLNVAGTFTAAAGRIHTINSGGGTIDVNAGQAYSLNAANQLTGSGALTKTGSGTLVLGNSMNFSGSVAINNGTLRHTANNVLGDNVPVSIAAGATLDLNGFNDTIGPLSFTGGTASSGAGTLTMNGDVTGNASSTMATISGNLSLGASTRIFNIANGGVEPDMDITAAISGGVGITKTGVGTLRLSGPNTFTGEADIQQGTLLLGASHRLGDSTPMRLSGGTFATGGNSDDVGTLTLSANSIIDLGTGSSILNFDPSNAIPWTGGTLLTIQSWNGLTAGGGTDRVIFGSSASGLTAGQVAQIRFLDPFGPGSGLIPAMILPSGEVVPIPEPGTVFAGLALAAAVGWRERKRIRGFLRKS